MLSRMNFPFLLNKNVKISNRNCEKDLAKFFSNEDGPIY